MTWEERLKPAAYTSPSGVRIEFDYEDVSRGFDKRTTAFETSGRDGTYVQDSGSGGRVMPITAFFSGPDYDLVAEAFEAALRERGRGRLEHPMYGTFDVVPFGRVTRKDALVSAGNQAVISVEFFESTGLFPTTQGSAAFQVGEAIEDFNTGASEEFAEVLDVSSAVEESSLADEYNAILTVTDNVLRGIAETQEDVRSKFNAVKTSIDRGLRILIGDPLTLARQTIQLVQLPGRAAASITDRLEGYGNLLTGLLESVGIQDAKANDSRTSNWFHTANLYASAYVSASVVSAVNNEFATKPDALTAADLILSQFAALVEWREQNYCSLGEVDTGAGYQALQKTVALSASFLVGLSFSLKQEKTVTLTRSRTVVDLVAELYGTTDEQLDFFINSNDLTGSEILEIPRGREIVYYV